VGNTTLHPTQSNRLPTCHRNAVPCAALGPDAIGFVKFEGLSVEDHDFRKASASFPPHGILPLTNSWIRTTSMIRTGIAAAPEATARTHEAVAGAFQLDETPARGGAGGGARGAGLGGFEIAGHRGDDEDEDHERDDDHDEGTGGPAATVVIVVSGIVIPQRLLILFGLCHGILFSLRIRPARMIGAGIAAAPEAAAGAHEAVAGAFQLGETPAGGGAGGGAGGLGLGGHDDADGRGDGQDGDHRTDDGHNPSTGRAAAPSSSAVIVVIRLIGSQFLLIRFRFRHRVLL
jgi:hypothetical protein